jgi:formamidopyrimidine-DNA glycosylase
LPELPEVEILRRYLNATSLHQEIRNVETHTDQILEGISIHELKASLKDRSFDSTRRHGKYLFVALDNKDWLVLHFGMTGRLKYYRDPSEEPEYTRLLIEFENDDHLALVMPRKLGMVQLISDVENFIQEKELGPDVYESHFDYDTFKGLLEGRRGTIKSTLMNQQIMAGIGNIYSDEILFQARIHPKKPVNQLGDEALREIFRATKEVLEMAIERKADPDQFPASWIIPHRNKGGQCPNCGGEVKNIIVSGRSAYYCPSCQSI